MKELSNTQFFQVETGPQIQAKDILEIVYNALVEKGYNPVNQIVGYIMSGDPTYITSYNGARSLVMKVERDAGWSSIWPAIRGYAGRMFRLRLRN